MIKTMTMIWDDHVTYMTQMSSVYHNIPMKKAVGKIEVEGLATSGRVTH